MAFNIVEFVNEQISDELLGRMGHVLGTDGTKTSIALGGALPGLLSGLSEAATRPGGANVLFDAVRRQDGGVLGDMNARLGGGDDTSRAIEEGNSTLGSLLGGDALGKLGGVLASFAGISRTGSGSLLGMLAPIVIGAIKRKTDEGSLDANALGDLLGEQRSNIHAAMPQGLAGQLRSEGFFDSISPNVGSTGGDDAPGRLEPAPPPHVDPAPVHTAAPPAAGIPPVGAAAARAAPAASRRPASALAKDGPKRWLLPIAAVVLLGILAWVFLGGSEEDAAREAVTATGDADIHEVTDADAELPEGVEIGKFTNAISSVVGSITGTLEGITDEAGARAALPQLKDANMKLGGLSENIARLPEATRPAITEAVESGLERLRPVADRVLAMPAVGPVVEPVLRPIIKTLEELPG